MAAGRGGVYRERMTWRNTARSWRPTLHALTDLAAGVGVGAVLGGLVVIWLAPSGARRLAGGGRGVAALCGGRPGRAGAAPLGGARVRRPAAGPVPRRARSRDPGPAARRGRLLGAAARAGLARPGNLAPARLPPAGPGRWDRGRSAGGGLLVDPGAGRRLVRRPPGRRPGRARRAGSGPAVGGPAAGGAVGGQGRGPGRRGRRQGPARSQPRRGAGGAGRDAGPQPGRDRRRHRRRTPPDRTRPPRRHPAPAGLPCHAPGQQGPASPTRPSRSARSSGPRRGHRGPGRAAPLVRGPPGRARRPPDAAPGDRRQRPAQQLRSPIRCSLAEAVATSSCPRLHHRSMPTPPTPRSASNAPATGCTSSSSTTPRRAYPFPRRPPPDGGGTGLRGPTSERPRRMGPPSRAHPAARP